MVDIHKCECLGLQWKHINLDDNIISVIKAGKKQNLYDQYSDFNDDFFLFAGKKRMDYKSFRGQRNRRFFDHTVHDLSHSYASYPANKGVDIFVLKDLLRHENIAITINTYSHIYDETRISAVSLLDN